MKEYIPLFLDFNESTQDLTDEECGRLVRAIVDYANGNDYENRLTGAEKIAFRFLKGAIDRNNAISEIRAKAGANKKKVEQMETNESKTEQNEANSVNKKRITKNNNENKKQKQEQEERFARFWAAYPRKEAKPKAQAAFEKLCPDEELLATMLKAIEQQKASDQWREDGGKYIPHPTTWLNGKRWEDQLPQTSKKVTNFTGHEQRSYDHEETIDEVMERFGKSSA